MSTGLSFEEAYAAAPCIARDHENDPIYLARMGENLAAVYVPDQEVASGVAQLPFNVLNEAGWESYLENSFLRLEVSE